MNIYCFRCKKRTESIGIEKKRVNNKSKNAWRLSCVCGECGTKKSSFIKSETVTVSDSDQEKDQQSSDYNRNETLY